MGSRVSVCVMVIAMLGVTSPALAQKWELEFVIVSSWYFGDGASQLNQAIASQLSLSRMNPSIVPLDAVLRSRFAERQAGATIGFRVSRVLSPRLSAEFTLESVDAKVALDSNSITGIESSRLSFMNGQPCRSTSTRPTPWPSTRHSTTRSPS